MPLKRRVRLPNGELGPLESVTGNPEIDPNLLMALEAIAAQQEEIETLKSEIETLKGGNS